MTEAIGRRFVLLHMKLVVETMGEVIAIVALAVLVFSCWIGIDQFIYSIL